MRSFCKVFILSFLVLTLLIGTTHARPEDWLSAKEILTTGTSPYQSFFLDGDVYRYAKCDLSDIRIIDKNGEFVPYYIKKGYLEEEQSEINYNSHLTDSFRKNNDTFQDFEMIPLQNDIDIIGDTLLFTLSTKDFLKQVDIYGSYDGLQWQFMITDTLYRAGGNTKQSILLPGPQKYRYYRIKLKDNVEGIVVENLILSHTQREIRNEGYRQTTRLPQTVENIDKKTIITFNNTSHIKIISVDFEIEDNHQRTYQLFTESGQITFGELYRLQFQDKDIINTTINLSQPVTDTTFSVHINNRDDKPLQIKDVAVNYLIDKVVFRDVGASPYTLYFHNPEAVKPSYEIEQFRNLIENEDQGIASLGKLTHFRQEEEKEPPRFDYLFNIVIGMVSIFLVLLLARQLKYKQQE